MPNAVLFDVTLHCLHVYHVILHCLQVYCVILLYRLKTLVSLPLGVAVSSLTVTPGNTHILIGLRDGKLIIVGARRACGGQVK